MPQKAIIGSVTSRLKTMAGYFHEIPEEHQLPFSELTEPLTLLKNTCQVIILKMSSCFIVSLCVSPVF